uniref:Uncharacterized protein n=1 Tax=Caenorhabditis japonica TaxID=281687 RepID=A0A8R1E413_CAEJA
MYFGGLPVLVGLKYFANLQCIRLFGQQITSLKPLGEVAPTLEELWVCEGNLKELDGVDHCVRLKKLFLYENAIEDASCLAVLTALQHLNLASNKLRNLAVIALANVRSVELGRKCVSDEAKRDETQTRDSVATRRDSTAAR